MSKHPPFFTVLLLWCIVAVGADFVAAADQTPRAYVIQNPDPRDDGHRYDGHLANLQVVLDLLRNGCQVHWIAALTATSEVSGDRQTRRGDYLVPMSQPRAQLAQLILSQLPSRRRNAIHSPLTYEAYPLNYPRILVDAQTWASNYYWYYDTLLAGGFAFEHLYEHNDRSLEATRHNLYIVPGGGGTIPAQYNALLRTYVSDGGNYLGSCWGCAQALYPSKVSYGSGNGAGLADAHNNEIIRSFGALGGVGHIILRNDAPDHPIMWDQPDEIHNIYWNGPVMRPGPFARELATFVRVVDDDFRFRSKDAAQRRLDAEEEHGKCLYLTSRRPGEGKVTVFGNHPEASDGVSPFAAHAMGHKAICNAILFSTAEAQQTHVLGKAVEMEWLRLAHRDPRNPNDAIGSLRSQAAALAQQLDKILAAGPRSWSEDDRSGFYLLRLRDALENLQQRQLQLAGLQPAAGGDQGALLDRFQRWGERTRRDVKRMSAQLASIDPNALNGSRSTEWHPLVGPLYERSIEATHLDRDLHYWGSLPASSPADSR